jgi:hypothetical protein
LPIAKITQWQAQRRNSRDFHMPNALMGSMPLGMVQENGTWKENILKNNFCNLNKWN